MTTSLSDVTVVLLPGTGSDDDYVHRAFAPALRALEATVVTPAPEPENLVAGYRRALDHAARTGRIAVGGVSIGAAVATAWAVEHQDLAVGVLAALPAWTGPPDDAPAALAARYSAQQLRSDGLAASVALMRAGSPPWLADELTRSWTGQWPALPDAMEEASRYVAPTRDELARLAVPLGLAAATDDAVHPVEVAMEWRAAAPRAALRTVTLSAMGENPAVLGDACVAALLEAFATRQCP
jgi:pimeloyl-ACP methyl ester carboxylesterase